jgi:hypothetical protein
MSNRITIELCEEDRQRIESLIGMTGYIAAYLKGLAEKTLTKAEEPEKAEPVNEHPVDEVSPHVAPEPVAESKPVAEANYTKADVQALVLKLAAPGAGKKDAVKAIVNEYAKKVSDIPEDKLNEVMAKLQKLAEEE